MKKDVIEITIKSGCLGVVKFLAFKRSKDLSSSGRQNYYFWVDLGLREKCGLCREDFFKGWQQIRFKNNKVGELDAHIWGDLLCSKCILRIGFEKGDLDVFKTMTNLSQPEIERKTTKSHQGTLRTRENGRLEWTCSHGIGHTVYAPRRRRLSPYAFSHGCDGCCRGEEFKRIKKDCLVFNYLLEMRAKK